MTLHPTYLIALRQAARRASAADHATLSLAIDSARRHRADVAALHDLCGRGGGPGLRAAFARASEALDLVAQTWDGGPLPDCDDCAAISREDSPAREMLLSSAVQAVYSQADADAREALRRAVSAVRAAAVSEGVEQAAAWMLDDLDAEDRYEREMAAL